MQFSKEAGSIIDGLMSGNEPFPDNIKNSDSSLVVDEFSVDSAGDDCEGEDAERELRFDEGCSNLNDVNINEFIAT